MKKALSKFMLAFVFRRSRRVQSHQSWSKNGARSASPTIKRDPSVVSRPTCVRSGRNRRFSHSPPPRGRRYGSCNAGILAPTRGLHTRNYRTCGACRRLQLQTLCHIRSHKLRMYPYTFVRARCSSQGCPISCETKIQHFPSSRDASGK